MVMGTELAPGIVCCASLCGSLGVPHHVTPWEQHRNGGDLVKQVRKPRVLLLRALLFWLLLLRVLNGRRCVWSAEFRVCSCVLRSGFDTLFFLSVFQNLKIRSLVKDKAMDKFRIVQCPKCRAYLQEPPPGNPFYECGGCFTTLQGLCYALQCRVGAITGLYSRGE